ncbi:hypothetical protein [Streptomyces geranii]|uniref:hypothetical protein n=1 Tax=Streptomyces geranii TaxID=2058923 RepID=UPI0013005972|nr:hypothetical protein [Streptomyces geranii]
MLPHERVTTAGADGRILCRKPLAGPDALRPRGKIYIIDEAHMVTSACFNAPLKVVEEPTGHLKLVFASSEPMKVIAMVRHGVVVIVTHVAHKVMDVVHKVGQVFM